MNELNFKTMTPEAKAKSLFHKVYTCPALKDDVTYIQAQIIAIMMAEEVHISCSEIVGYDPDEYPSDYWEEVKENIMKL